MFSIYIIFYESNQVEQYSYLKLSHSSP